MIARIYQGGLPLDPRFGDSGREQLADLRQSLAASRKVLCELLTQLPTETRQVFEAFLDYHDDHQKYLQARLSLSPS